MTTSGPTSYD